MMISFQGLDVETRPTNDNPQEYALMPWRALSGQAEVSYCAVVHDFKHGYCYDFENLAYHDNVALAGVAHALGAQRDCDRESFVEGVPRYTVAWNALFDVSWLLCSGASAKDLKEINWLDAMLLWKWLESDLLNYSLAAAVRRWLSVEEYPWIEGYLQLKEQEKEEGFDTPNTRVYCRADAFVTVEIARKLWNVLPEEQKPAFLIEQACIFTVARSWCLGVPVDVEAAGALEGPIREEMAELEAKLGLTAKQLRSPIQLREIIYNEWGMLPENFTDKGDPSTDKTALTYGSDTEPRCATILDWRERNTRLTKYIEGPQKASEYNGRAVTHSAPRLFSTYTGRMTYSSKTLKKHPNGIALHQWCREKRFRKIIQAPPGCELVEFDASGQEMRGMAEQSGDATMLRIFAQGMDAHSYTGAAIGGWEYKDFMDRKKVEEELKLEDGEITGPKGLRYQGKFVNLSLQFRIGTPALRRKARIDYGFDATIEEAAYWKSTYFKLFPAVKTYWATAIQRAKMLGYAETLGGRRYYIPAWRYSDEKHKWSAESSAINFPIQGTGADQKELGIYVMEQAHPELIFAFDLHDGLFYWKKKGISRDILLEARDTLDNMDYQKHWGYSPSIPLPWDASIGERWGEMEEL